MTRCISTSKARHWLPVLAVICLTLIGCSPKRHSASLRVAKPMTLEYHNPVWDGYLADPHVLRTRGEYYAYGTGDEHEGRRFPVLHSKDFVHWTFVGNALESVTDPPLKAYWCPSPAKVAPSSLARNACRSKPL